MTDRYSAKGDAARRLAELRKGEPEPSVTEEGDGLEFEPDDAQAAFTILSADRQHKLMVEFRFLTGNAKGLAYSYLVGADFNPSEGIKLDFSGYAVAITGRNLRPLFDGLIAQRVAVVREMDALHAEANLEDKATAVTSIKVTEV
jgi:hypothetical protein